MTVAVLALQGAFIEHINILNELGINTVEVRQKSNWDLSFDGLIIPGGESTVIGKLLHELDLFWDVRDAILAGLPVMGTCAGMIVLAQRIVNQHGSHLATMDIAVRRNAFGRQFDSFNISADFAGEPVEMPFIRAPYIESVGDGVEVLSVVNDKIVAARQGNQLATAFHPELTHNHFVHEYFVDMVMNCCTNGC
ncbi:MAG: glutamine amidotransferase subunit PdxT [Epulopiscium sp. Nuni2H_MBin001]|nr:MAG: glutamine amidotransferase subunit PdxT [Epulopiscium sp. Nuni2H_MBin001]